MVCETVTQGKHTLTKTPEDDVFNLDTTVMFL